MLIDCQSVESAVAHDLSALHTSACCKLDPPASEAVHARSGSPDVMVTDAGQVAPEQDVVPSAVNAVMVG